ncbi:MAG: aminotransferase class III [Legionellales bacterium RIFCSPHIGHO2_12_FULL_37_14]|nr:MAG: aminotransferase class III [Legionellales bacterium RIFCSPHIGHO2_12_FULL_37_14]
MTNKFIKSSELFQRAQQVIPCGIYGHATPALMVAGKFPYYTKEAKGSRYFDVDNNEYIDWMCGYGPVILGHQHPIVEAAAFKSQRKVLCSNHPTEIMIELAEYLVNLVDFASWAIFGKNGSDMTTWAIQVAREYTKRKKILKVKGSYHGIDPWCTPGHAGLIPEDRVHIHEFIWNSLNSFEDQVKKYRNEIAAVILTPFHHPPFANSELPQAGFLSGIEKICLQEGIVFILDDVRAGFRLNHRGSHRYFNFTPDLICFCKAIANGHPLSATLGRKELRIAASRVFLTGSYWNSQVPMAAALACLKTLEKHAATTKMAATGTQLMQGLVKLAQEYGFKATASGPAALPFLTFDNDTDLHLQQQFCSQMIAQGVFLHPHHNWFVSDAHTKKDVTETLNSAKLVFSEMQD